MVDDALSVGAVARQLGVAVTTLRTWHQRYGLGPSGHVPGQHRRYTAEDLARLEVMRRLTVHGVAPAEAARRARRAPAVPDPGPDWARPSLTRSGGGAVVPVGRAGPAARGLARAATRLDAVGMRAAIARSIAADGVVATWETMLCPVLVSIGERHAATAGLIEVEHLVSRCVSEAFAVVARPSGPVDPARILLACADEEQHTLPLEALAAALAESGVDCRLLGARVPTAALVEAAGRTAPDTVVIWSHARSTADPAQLTALLAGPRPPLLVLAAGPGWRAETLPPGILRPATLTEAVNLVLALREPPDEGEISDLPVSVG